MVSLPGRSRAAESAAAKFKLRFAPHPGMFKEHAGEDVIDQIKFAADQGFTSWEDNGMGGRPPELQEKIGKTLSDLGMKMGVFVATGRDLIIDMEHGKSISGKEGELAVIEAYRKFEPR